MKSFLSVFLATFIFSGPLAAQELSGCFSADNCYAVYLGNETSVTQQILPSPPANIEINTLAADIFNATCFVDVPYSAGDWLYIIVYSDDSRCQGLIGEFEDAVQLKSGQDGWQVYPTGIDKDPGSTPPTDADITSQIGIANSGNAWVDPYVGLRNDETSKLCRWYDGWPKVRGISDDANWVWHNTGNHNHAQAPFYGYDHEEYLIFRFPVSKVSDSGCCEEFIKQLNEMDKKLDQIMKLLHRKPWPSKGTEIERK